MLDTPPYKFAHPKTIERINKKLLSAGRVWEKRQEYLKKQASEKPVQRGKDPSR